MSRTYKAKTTFRWHRWFMKHMKHKKQRLENKHRITSGIIQTEGYNGL